MILLHAFCPDIGSQNRQDYTWDWLRRNEPLLTGMGWTVRHAATPKSDPLSYTKALRAAWETREGFVTLEQDVLPFGIQQFIDLRKCPFDWCEVQVPPPYLPREEILDGVLWMGPAPPHLTSTRVAMPNGSVRYARPDEDFGDISSTGFVKYSASLCTEPFPWGGSFGSDDWVTSQAIRALGKQVHIHRPPAEHLHPAHEDWPGPIRLRGLSLASDTRWK